MLVLQNVSKHYTQKDGRAVPALQEVTFSLSAGDFASVQGPSGCGKSTLLLACGGLLSPDGGQVLLADNDVYAQSPNLRARLRAEYIGFVFQQFHLIPYLSLKDNILSGAMARQHEHPETCADTLMTRLDLHSRADHLVSTLSIGERQRTALARALVCQPRLILADEPTGNLDPDNTQIVLRSLAEFAEAGGTVLLVTHDPNSTGYANRHFLMHQGVLRESLG